jgi:uncharacterized RDD family membrane protein YckC
MRVALGRIAAWLIDWACILGWVAITLAIGLPLHCAGIIRLSDIVTQNVVAAIVVVVPVVLFAAAFESRGRAATPGKRALHLQVRSESRAPGIGRALARNALKIGLPWLIGHATVFAILLSITDGQSPPAGIWILIVVTYALPLVYIVSLFVGDGRTPYDRLTRTRVTASTPRDTPPPSAKGLASLTKHPTRPAPGWRRT